MAEIWGKAYSRAQLLERVGDMSQLAHMRPAMLVDGPHRDVEVIDVRTGGGLGFVILPGRGMDISAAHHNGQSLSWHSQSGEVHSAFHMNQGLEWLRGFFGGLVATCGLSNAGAPSEDDYKELGLHGRYSNTPASAISIERRWDGDEYIMTASGTIREGGLFQDNLELRRSITTSLGSTALTIHDEVVNTGFHTSPHQLLYHINLGFPVIDEGSEWLSPASKVTPRDADAVDGAETSHLFDSPTKNYVEKVYYHEPVADAKGMTLAAIVNRDLGLGVAVRYRLEQLPRLIEWKMMGQGEYVVGIEPANCLVEGRHIDRENGILKFLEPGESSQYEVTIEVLPDSDSIAAIEQEVAAIAG